jgi:hypothetical protein
MSYFLNTYELDEWADDAEDRAYADDLNDDADDDFDIRQSYYPETLP